jgi:hypothetical protein
MFTGKDGKYHMCMQRRGHAGPCKCSHFTVEKGTPLFENNPGGGGGGTGHRSVGAATDEDLK